MKWSEGAEPHRLHSAQLSLVAPRLRFLAGAPGASRGGSPGRLEDVGNADMGLDTVRTRDEDGRLNAHARPRL